MAGLIIVVGFVGIASIAGVRFLRRRYRELYGSSEPPYEDPPVIPLQGSHGGLM